jgi:hypothetical protein
LRLGQAVRISMMADVSGRAGSEPRFFLQITNFLKM